MAIALANDPQLLLLDEATGDLDTRTTVLILLPLLLLLLHFDVFRRSRLK
jgi:ABC-type methionine transport system ATPase subunit